LVVPNDLDRFSDGIVFFSEWSVRDVPNNHVGYGIYRLHPDGTLQRVIEGNRPNGVAFSADCSILYTTDGDTLYARDVAPDGTLSNQRTFFSRSRLNGIAVDSQGNVYVSGDGGMVAVNAEGQQVASLSTEDPVVNFAFGGDGAKILFFTTRNGIGWVQTRVRGAECNGLGK